MNAKELNEAGKQCYQRGEWRLAAHHYEQALQENNNSQVDDLLTRAQTLDALANLYCYQLGQRQQAFDYYQQALVIWQAAGDIAGEIVTSVNIAGLYQAEARFEEARELMEHVIELDQAIDSPHIRNHRIILGAIRKRLRRLAEENL